MPTEEEKLHEAIEHQRAGRIAEAAEVYLQILGSNPEQVEALYLLGVIAHQTGHYEESVELNGRAISISPDDVRCYNVLGLSLIELGRDSEAESSFERAISIQGSPECYNNLGILWTKQGRVDEAIGAYLKALAEAPNYANAHYNLGNAYRQQGEMLRAAESFERAIEADSEHAGAMAGLGQALQKLNRNGEAIAFFERALALLPGDADLYCDLGDTLQATGRLEEATVRYRQAVDHSPSSSRAWFSAGCAADAAREHAAAAEFFRKALEASPGWSKAQHNLGQALFRLGQVDEALALLRAAVREDDGGVALAAAAVMIPGVASSDQRAILETRRTWASRHLPPSRPANRFARTVREAGRRLRVGYVSAYFQGHNWMKPVWGLINQHDRERFEVHLFSDGTAAGIEHGYRRHASDGFHEISELSNDSAADLIESVGVDVLVDLNGYSVVERLPLFALRPAPIQIAWFNMYATSGMDCYDYLVGDHVVVSEDEEQFYSERIHQVAGSYLTFEVTYPVPAVAPPPSLENGAITFGCLAPQYKITKDVVAAWIAILRGVPNSSLILKNSVLGAEGNRQFVHALFTANGVAAGRVRLEGPADHHAFLETYDRIDIALDTFPYNGGTTTTEAIWQGVPVVAFTGDRWVSRTSASILEAGGLGEYVGANLADYIALAIRLGNSPDTPARLAELRMAMRGRLAESSVCDTKAFARQMERLYREGLKRADGGAFRQ